jgi:acyl-CoA synthetase (AMP-forming)/AMP-acid ligase II/acyl carrier protein
MILTIGHMISNQADLHPDAIAIEAPNRKELTYGKLNAQVIRTWEELRSFGIRRNDPIGIVLSNGPEMATAFLSIAPSATCAPLNPAYRESEFEFYLSDLSARAIVVETNLDSPVRKVAQSLGIPVIELESLQDQPAGTFELRGDIYEDTIAEGLAEPDDIALVLHTSGTTSRPKIVPITHKNLIASAKNIRSSLNLAKSDRCLNVMPLFHIHGLVAAILATISTGASVVCTPGFYAPNFFDWLAAFRPTWFTAVPTMHMAVLSRAKEQQDIIRDAQLRFIRSCSASLPPKIMAELESTFGVPIIEAYGMTEASHQMTSNPLPLGEQKPGSVGVPTGVEVAVMSEEEDSLLDPGITGEVVIRGENVIEGYLNNPQANEAAFTKGWFRTGDQGHFDDEGYLFLTGRIKEIINRGGEKISPREIDEVLIDHPKVSQAVTFSVPESSLGEDIASAVIVNDPDVSESELRQFTNARLSYFKVPRRILIVEKIPKGPTGKLQRIGLAEKFGLDFREVPETEKKSQFLSPRNPVEDAISTVWIDVLKIEKIGVLDRFLDLGGDSLLASQLISRLRQTLNIEINLIDFFDAPTIAEQAVIVQELILAEELGSNDP